MARETPDIDNDWYDGDEEISREELNKKHDKVFNRVLSYKVRVLDKMFERVKNGADPESMNAFTSLAESTEDSIHKRHRIEIEREKNAINRESNENFSEALNELQERRLARNQERRKSKEELRKDKSKRYESQGGKDVKNEETISGIDNQSYKDFKNRRQQEEDNEE